MIYLIYTADAIISKPNSRVGFFKSKNEKLPLDEQVVFLDVDDVPDIYQVNPNKILIVEESKTKLHKAKLFFQNMNEISIVQSQTTFIDVSPENVSKGTALKLYAEHLGLNASEVAAIGDHDNDVAMLMYAGTAIAMENATLDCLEVANYVTLSNNANGVANAIYKYVLQ